MKRLVSVSNSFVDAIPMQLLLFCALIASTYLAFGLTFELNAYSSVHADPFNKKFCLEVESSLITTNFY